MEKGWIVPVIGVGGQFYVGRQKAGLIAELPISDIQDFKSTDFEYETGVVYSPFILEVYSPSPEFIQYDLKIEVSNYMGLLEFKDGFNVKVLGQQRIEALKKAIQHNPSLNNEYLPVMFIAHNYKK